jgi:DNA-directed RNA polymerase specialized sigma24 family protein
MPTALTARAPRPIVGRLPVTSPLVAAALVPGPDMADRQQLEALLVEHLGLVDRICAALARRSGLRGAEAEDFAAWARLRLVENDYDVLARFRGDSSLPTYLVAVLTQAAYDYRVRERGRWRTRRGAAGGPAGGPPRAADPPRRLFVR